MKNAIIALAALALVGCDYERDRGPTEGREYSYCMVVDPAVGYMIESGCTITVTDSYIRVEGVDIRTLQFNTEGRDHVQSLRVVSVDAGVGEELHHDVGFCDATETFVRCVVTGDSPEMDDGFLLYAE